MENSQQSRDQAIGLRFDGVTASRTFRRLVETFGLGKKKVLDLGCSYGEHLVHFGKGSKGVTTTTEEVEYATRKGINVVRGNVELIDEVIRGEQFDVLWANNLFEHLLSPHAFLVRLKGVSPDKGMLILGVDVIPSSCPWFLLRFTKFRGALASPHVLFFNRDTARRTIEAAGWRIIEMRSFYFSLPFLDRLFTPFAPHLYVIAENDASFRYNKKKRNEWIDDPMYAYLFELTERP